MSSSGSRAHSNAEPQSDSEGIEGVMERMTSPRVSKGGNLLPIDMLTVQSSALDNRCEHHVYSINLS